MRLRWLACVALLASLPATRALASTLEIHGLVQYFQDDIGQASDGFDQVSPDVNIADGAHVAAQGVGSAQNIGSAHFGLLGTQAGAESSGARASFLSSGEVSWLDTFVITPANPALLGTPGTFTFDVGVAGSGGVLVSPPAGQWSGTARWDAFVRISTPTFCFSPPCLSDAGGEWVASYAQPAYYIGDPPSVRIGDTVGFFFGQEVELAVALRTSADAQIFDFGSVESSANFIGTLAWGGFSEVRDAQGALIPASAFQVVSDSGTDWARAVPEPSTGLLLAAGFVALAETRRRLRQRVKASTAFQN